MISSKHHNFTLKELEKEDEITQARKWKEIMEMREREIKNYLELNENLFNSVGHRKSSSNRKFILMSSDI
jgi:uncharacterized protein with HEPN domain